VAPRRLVVRPQSVTTAGFAAAQGTSLYSQGTLPATTLTRKLRNPEHEVPNPNHGQELSEHCELKEKERRC